MPEVRPFRFRPYRIAVRLELDFYLDSKVLHGTSRDISADGIRAELDGLLHVGSRGKMAIRIGASCIELHAVATYIHRNETAFAFEFNSPWERERLSALVHGLQKVCRNQKDAQKG